MLLDGAAGGGAGSDVLFGGRGDDTLTLSGGRDAVRNSSLSAPEERRGFVLLSGMRRP